MLQQQLGLLQQQQAQQAQQQQQQQQQQSPSTTSLFLPPPSVQTQLHSGIFSAGSSSGGASAEQGSGPLAASAFSFSPFAAAGHHGLGSRGDSEAEPGAGSFGGGGGSSSSSSSSWEAAGLGEEEDEEGGDEIDRLLRATLMRENN
jgi:hypothetical protein